VRGTVITFWQRRRAVWRELLLTAAGVVTLGTLLVAARTGRALPPAYHLAEVGRGKAVTKVIAAGTLQPVVSVVVGSQVSGQVKEILVDHNDAVKAGQPIALLDPELFNTRVEQARADVEVASDAVRIAQGEVTTAEATVDRAVAERGKAEADSKRHEVTIGLTRQRLERKSALVKSGAVSASDTDDARAGHETALAKRRKLNFPSRARA
jgi:HlyD family secretion protein